VTNSEANQCLGMGFTHPNSLRCCHLAAQLEAGSTTDSSDWKLGVVQSPTRSRSPSMPKKPQFSQPLVRNCAHETPHIHAQGLMDRALKADLPLSVIRRRRGRPMLEN
jgi:hypothetical protein